MNKRRLKLQYWLNNFPIRPNFILLIGLMSIVYFWLFAPKTNKESEAMDSFQPLVALLAKVGLIVIAILILVSILSTIVTYIIYRNKKKLHQSNFALNIQNENASNQAVKIRPSLKQSLRPLLGYISGKLILKDKSLSKTFVLASTQYQKNSLRTQEIYGSGSLYFPDIQTYQIDGTLIYFEDMLRLIRLSVKEPYTTSFYNPPSAQINVEPNVQPQASKEMEVRIDQMRNVEGEYLNYKQFEYGDDVRRIVWKIYGKNRELIVRNPEMRNPFASKIEMFASFHCHLSALQFENQIAKILLNNYKNAVWTLYRSLSEKQEWHLQYVPEHWAQNNIEDKDDNIAYQIAQATWQNHTNIESYFDLKKGTVFCIHSLTAPEALMHFLENGGDEKFIYMAYLSDSFKNNKVNWLKRLFFFEAENKSDASLQTAWMLSPLKAQITKNEAFLTKILKSYGF